MMAAANRRASEAEQRYEQAREAQEREAARHREELEIRDAFGERGLEEWPMFAGKKVWRVAESEHFDGRVSAEFRVKDAASGEPGVSLLMGRLAGSKASEVHSSRMRSTKRTCPTAASTDCSATMSTPVCL